MINYGSRSPETLREVRPELFNSARIKGVDPSDSSQYGLSFVKIEHDIRTNGVSLFDFGPDADMRPWIGVSTEKKGDLEEKFGEGVPEQKLVGLAQKIRGFSGGIVKIDSHFGAVRNGARRPFGEEYNMFLTIDLTDDSPVVDPELQEEFDRLNVIPELRGEIEVPGAIELTPDSIVNLVEQLDQHSILTDMKLESLNLHGQHIAFRDPPQQVPVGN